MSKPLNAYEQLAKDMGDVEYKPAPRPVFQLHQHQKGILDACGDRRFTVINATGRMATEQERKEAAERLVKFLNDNREYLSGKPLPAIPRWLTGEDDEDPFDDLAKARTTPWRERFVLTIPKPVDPWWPQVTGGKTKIGPTDV